MKDLINNLIALNHNRKYHIIIDKNKYELLQSGEKVDNKPYSINLIKTILNEYYYNLKRLYKNKEDEIILFVKEDKNTNKIFIDNPIEFLNSIDLLFKQNKLTKHEIKKYQSILKYIDNSKQDNFVYYYEGEEKQYPIDEIIELLSLDNIEFKKKIDSMTDEFLVLVATFVKNMNNVYSNNVIENAKYISSITKEYGVLEKIKLRTKPSYLNQIKLNEQFEKYIMSKVPDNFTIFEKAIFIYILLCKTLTHDEEDADKCTINHRNPNRIKTIDQNNNLIVCYEFVVIFTKFLDILGLDYEIIGGKKYGMGHTSLNILYKDSLTNVEATQGLFNCDLTRIKNNIRASGFNPIKYNPKIQKEINESFDNVYKYLSDKYNEKYYYETDIVKQYRKNIDDNLTYEDRLQIFFEKIKHCTLPPVDTIKYISLLKKAIFGKTDIFNMNIILNCKANENKNCTLSIVFTFKNNNNDIKYYIYTYPNTVTSITQQEMQSLFDNNDYKYIKYLKKDIPGIQSKIKK